MTQKEKIYLLATKVMGLKMDGQCIDGLFMTKDGIYDIDIADEYEWVPWNPYKSWNHAGKLAEKLRKKYEVILGGDRDDWSCLLMPYDYDGDIFDSWIKGSADTGPAAISEAAFATIKEE